MSILVAFASKHGATQEIAERIAEKLTAAGQKAEARQAGAVDDLARYDAFVIGSAVYGMHWLNDATELVWRNRGILAHRPVWLFSSGPLGAETTDAQGRDRLTTAEPKEFGEFREAIGQRDHRVFFGALDSAKLSAAEQSIRESPDLRARLPEGDFRDWAAIEAWAESIARDPILGGRKRTAGVAFASVAKSPEAKRP